MRRHARAPAAHDVRDIGVRPDHRERAHAVRAAARRRGSAAARSCPTRARRATSRSTGSSTDSSGPRRRSPSSAPGAFEHASARAAPCRRGASRRPRPPRTASRELRTEPLRRSRHLEVEAGVGRGSRCCACRTSPRRRTRRTPTPASAASSSSHGCSLQYVPFSAVVRGHHRPRAGFAHRGFERRRARSRAACARRPRS